MIGRDPSNPVWVIHKTMRADLKSRDFDEMCDAELFETEELLEHWLGIVRSKRATRLAAKRTPAPEQGDGDD